MLVLTRRVNERIIIGEDIEIVVVDIRGEQVKIGIEAPKDTRVYRKEVFEEIQAENRRASEAKEIIDKAAEQMARLFKEAKAGEGEEDASDLPEKRETTVEPRNAVEPDGAGERESAKKHLQER
ncbi:MAG TPA: carbon storage regulator CsrA [Clostridia bacterium]|nr:carbon storage regulator CsrA [Clostridia bacterium]